MLRRLSIAVAALLCTVGLYAAVDVPDVRPGTQDQLAVYTTATAGENGEILYDVIAGPIATNAIRIYSEPSHTLLVMVVDSNYAETEAGKAWLKTIGATNVTFWLLPARHLTFRATPPEHDDMVATWVNGNYFGVERDEMVGTQLVGTAHVFGSGQYVPKPGTVSPERLKRIASEEQKACGLIIHRTCVCNDGTISDDYNCAGTLYICCYYLNGSCILFCPAQLCKGYSPVRPPSAPVTEQ